MKLTHLMSLIVVLLCLGIGTNLYAGLLGDERILVNLPRNVMIGDQTLPAGEYEFRSDASFVLPVVDVYNVDQQKYEATVLPNKKSTKTEQPADHSRVVLERVGNTYYVTEIWIAGRIKGFEIPLPDRAQALKEELQETYSGSGD